MTDPILTHHPLPWRMPGREKAVRIEGNLHQDDRPYQLVAGNLSGVSIGLTVDQMRALRDGIDAILAAPFTVLVFGGDKAADWMADRVAARLGEALARHPNMVVEHACRPGSVDETVADWCEANGVGQHIRQPDVALGGNATLIFQTGDGERNMELVGAAHRAGIPAWWCRGPEGGAR